MTYVDNPRPSIVSYWVDEDKNGPGRYIESRAPPVLLCGAWGRDPAAEKAKANFDAKHGPPSFFSQAAKAE